MAQMLVYCETHLFPNNYNMFIAWIRLCNTQKETNNFNSQKAVPVLKNIMAFNNINRL
jgi:hypothetical protein